jgi:hypothetical protein
VVEELTTEQTSVAEPETDQTVTAEEVTEEVSAEPSADQPETSDDAQETAQEATSTEESADTKPEEVEAPAQTEKPAAEQPEDDAPVPEAEVQGNEDKPTPWEAKPQAEPAPVAPQVIEKTVVQRKVGFVPTVIGGIIAAALGYGAATYTDVLNGNDTQQQAQLTAALDELRAQGQANAKALEGADLAALSQSLTILEDKVNTIQSSLSGYGDQIATYESRLDAIEKLPLAQAVSPEAIAAYERELEELRVTISEQKDAVSAQGAEMREILSQARASEASAEVKAQLAASRSALSDLSSRLQAGKPYGDALAVLVGNGVNVPDAVAAAATDGVPGLSRLIADFPPVAREALKLARSLPAAEGEEAPKKGIGSFLQNSLGARSTTPQEGSSPDAVLSRVEAAVKSSDLDSAMSEIASLPEPVQAVMADWMAKVDLRRNALAGAAVLAQELNNK